MLADVLEPPVQSGGILAAGRLAIPNLPTRKTEAPVLSMPRIRLDPYPRTVIERNRGTTTGGMPNGYTQRVDQSDNVDFTI